MQRQQRSKSEKISDILKSVRNYTGTRITQIMYETYIPYNQLKEYMTVMIQNELCVYIEEEKIFRITDYGMYFLRLHGEMDKLLDYNILNTVGIMMRK